MRTGRARRRRPVGVLRAGASLVALRRRKRGAAANEGIVIPSSACASRISQVLPTAYPRNKWRKASCRGERLTVSARHSHLIFRALRREHWRSLKNGGISSRKQQSGRRRPERIKASDKTISSGIMYGALTAGAAALSASFIEATPLNAEISKRIGIISGNANSTSPAKLCKAASGVCFVEATSAIPYARNRRRDKMLTH